uniref:Uncharacterized protein n=1 Tax=Pelagomonas calceolata TaxID=35677 RepID=A0A7S3ZUW9_9STRA|mmetsp:Transcript_23365/g.69914  ORF Transcript_23365/g.69914 Transcript_23365/m.69914 type:complete len:684 (-) Transcript_23365:16-2067(-)
MMRPLVLVLAAAAATAVDVDAVSMDGEAAAVQGQSAAAPPPRMNPRHNNPKDWAQQADASAAALGALEAKDQNKVVPSAATGDSGAAAPKEASEPASEKEPLVESGEDAAAAFRGAVAAFLSEKGLAPDEAMAASELREAQYEAAAAVLRRAAATAPSLLRTLADEAERLQKNNAQAIADMITKAEAAVDKNAKDKAKALLEVWKGQVAAKAGAEPDAAEIARASEAFSAHVALEAREEIAIEKAQVAVGEIVGGLMLPAEKSAIDAMLIEAEKEGVIAAQAEFEKDGNAAVKAAAIERAKAVAKQAVAEVAGSVRGKNGRAEADLSSSELYAAKRALISCLQGLPDDERLAKVDQHGVRGCEFEASMDWLSREEGAPVLSGFRDRHRVELQETVDQFRMTASKMGKAVLIANATLKAKTAFDRTCVGFPASDPPEPCIAAAERAADGAAVEAEAAVIEAAEGDDASFTRSHIAALTDETKAAIREWARLRLSRGSSESNDCHGRAVQTFEAKCAEAERAWNRPAWERLFVEAPAVSTKEPPQLDNRACPGRPSTELSDRADARRARLRRVARAADAATEATYVAFMGVSAALALLTIVLRCCCRCSSSICLLLLIVALTGQVRVFQLIGEDIGESYGALQMQQIFAGWLVISLIFACWPKRRSKKNIGRVGFLYGKDDEHIL